MRPIVPYLAAALFGVAPLLPLPARASLGGGADSIESDRKALAASRLATTAGAAFTVQELDAGGTRIRQYLSPSGVVFAVAWNGLTHPDLGPLLGTYAAAFREAEARTARVPGRRQHEVRTDRLVVQRFGHMRNLQGRAWAPALLPPGVELDAIR